MPSQAYGRLFQSLTSGSGELQNAHAKLKTGKRGRQWGLSALNRASVVLAVAAWESYIESIVIEAISLTKPPTGPQGLWLVAHQAAETAIGRLNAPNPANVKRLLNLTLALPDVTRAWRWPKASATTTTKYLDMLLTLRHEIAHGASPVPNVSNADASYWTTFVINLSLKTDAALDAHLQNTFGVTPRW